MANSVAATIRLEEPQDVPVIHAINRAAFPTSAEADLVDRLRDRGNLTRSLVAVVGDASQQDEVVGHLALSPVDLLPSEPAVRGLGLAPMAVLPSWQNHGFGSQLVRAGIEAARVASFHYVVVLGDPAYYRRFGFRPASEFSLGNEYGADEAFMAIELERGALAECHGTVRYGQEFAELE